MTWPAERRRTRERGRRDEGMALLLALLFVVLLTALVVEYSYETRVEAARSEAGSSSFRARVAAKSAVMTGLALLTADLLNLDTQSQTGAVSADPSADYDGLDEPWALGIPLEMNGDAAMQCVISDEYGKLNLNALVDSEIDQPNEVLLEALRILFEQRGASPNPVYAIVDWIDANEDEMPDGAEAGYYQGLETPYACRNAPFGAIEELMLVRGMTLEVFLGDPGQEQLPLTELLTVHGNRRGRVNVNTAPYEVLDVLGQAFGLGGFADIVIEQRSQSPFLTRDEVAMRAGVPVGSAAGGVSDRAPSSYMGVDSRCFRVRGQGLCGESAVRIDAYVRRDARLSAQPMTLLDWRELQ